MDLGEARLGVENGRSLEDEKKKISFTPIYLALPKNVGLLWGCIDKKKKVLLISII